MAPKPVRDLKVKLFADGAERAGSLNMYSNPLIRGFTTNPTLMRKAGITDYEAFAKDIVSAVPDRPLSLEVFADEFAEMERQALKIWAALHGVITLAEQGLLTGQLARISREELVEEIVEQTKLALAVAIEAADAAPA